jgi:vacuolar-type H+-ATPase subunit H
MLQRTITPALADHLQTQMQFFNNWANTVVDSVRQMNSLNIELAKELLGDATQAGQQMRDANGAAEIASTGVSRLLPAAEKLRMHQQRLASIVANTNLELVKKAESYLPQASRTASAVADEITRQATAEAEKLSQHGQKAAEQVAQATPVAEENMPRKGKPNPQQAKQQNQPQSRGS